MSIFDYLFSRKSDSNQSVSVPIQFGRYIDDYKTKKQYDYWDKSLVHFEQNSFFKAIDCFFHYLKSPTSSVYHEQNNTSGEFAFYQGSKRVFGSYGTTSFRAVSLVASCPTSTYDVAVLRKLLSYNYSLKYSRFSINQSNELCIVFDCSLSELSPFHLFYGLRELSLFADNVDDLLVQEFDCIDFIDNLHITSYSDDILEAKVSFLKSSYKNLLDKLASVKSVKLDIEGGKSYLILSFVYDMDFLLSPQGFVKEKFEEIHRVFFGTQLSTIDKNTKSLSLLADLFNSSEETLKHELYMGKFTFGQLDSIGTKDDMDQFITKELGAFLWYKSNELTTISNVIPSYVIGYCSFNFGFSSLLRDLFFLYYRVNHPVYFESLGIDKLDFSNKELIQSSINEVVSQYKDVYKPLALNFEILSYSSIDTFNHSLLLFIKQLDIVRI